MAILERLTAVTMGLVDDHHQLADEINVVIDLMKELALKHDDPEVTAAVEKLEAVHTGFDKMEETLKETVKDISASHGDAE